MAGQLGSAHSSINLGAIVVVRLHSRVESLDSGIDSAPSFVTVRPSLRGSELAGKLAEASHPPVPGGLGEVMTVDNSLFSEQIQVERKLLSFELRENARGRFMRVTEDVGGRRDTVIVPAAGLIQVRDILGRVIAASEEAGPFTGPHVA